MDRTGGKAGGEAAGTLRSRADLQKGLLRRRPSTVQMACSGEEGEEEEAQGEEGIRAPRPLPRLTPRVGPEGHGPVALHQVRPFEAVFVFKTAMWQRGWGACSRGVASHAIATDEATERQQQGAEEPPSSGLGTPLPGSRHLGFCEEEAGERGRGAGAADGQQGAR